jgi:hypothetical protein
VYKANRSGFKEREMKKAFVLLVLLVMLSINSTVMALTLSDGQSHTISTYVHSGLELDPDNDIIPGTHVNLVDGGEFKGVDLYHHATIDINGGKVNFRGFHAEGDSVVTITDGLVKGYSYANSNSTVIISGGNIKNITLHDNTRLSIYGGSLEAFSNNGNSVVSVFGGSIKDYLRVGGNGIIYLYGTDFEVNGQTLSPGDRLSDFATLEHWGETHYHKTGIITGILTDGSALNNTFSIIYWDGIEVPADIIIAPKPTIEISIDIKPQSCPDIDIDTILLEGVAPTQIRYKDETAPVVDEQECGCHSKKKDGYVDLSLKFKTQDVVVALGEVVDGETWMLHLTGNLKDGTPIEGADCIDIKKRGKK